ncbi:uncharacterized protein LOC135334988 [Halichondria panicea]|uniref:uncharacterized protein LOC135334988 n=1 Tax=Halichondria panicea TaxID=6063 RepID=UPI00312BBDAA
MSTYIVLLSLLLIHFNEGRVTIKFDERQTTIRENDCGEIHVSITGQRARALCITVRPITFSEFTGQLPSEYPPESLPDPAEVEDFNHGAITLPSFNGGAGATVFTVDISSLIDDDVNERNEGFWLLIEVQNEDHVTIERSGLALVIIKDNDPISIGFALPVLYETMEQNGIVDDLVFVVKDGNVKSEQVLKILVMATSGSADMGVDFSALRLTELVFQPEDEAVPFPFHLYEDQIPEGVEHFPLFLSLDESQPGLQLSALSDTMVKIQDNNGNECDDTRLNDCAPNALCERTSDGHVCSCPPGFVGFPMVVCVDVDECSTPILNSCTPANLCVNTPGSFKCTCPPGDNRCISDKEMCSRDSDCVDRASCQNRPLGRCVCNDGFSGDGRTCTDIDECTAGTDECGDNSDCINTLGSYMCRCNTGFKLGSSNFECEDKDECAIYPNICENTEQCVNTPGSYECRVLNEATPRSRPNKKRRKSRKSKSTRMDQ